MVRFEANLVVLVVSLLAGGLAIHLGAIFALKARNYAHAVVTAAVGSLAWWLLELAFEELQVAPGPLASLVGLVVWIGVLRHRYDAGWVRATAIGVFAVVSALVVLSVLSALGVRGVDPYGVP